MRPVLSSGSWRNKQTAEGNQGLYLQAVVGPHIYAMIEYIQREVSNVKDVKKTL